MKRFGITLAAAFACAATSFAQPTGQWDFESGNLSATVGTAMTYADGPGAGTSAATQFGTTTSFGIPDIGGAAARVMKTAGGTAGLGYLIPTPLAGNGGGLFVNDYTIVMDVLFPTESDVKPRALLDADALINPDAEFFVNADNGLGSKGQSTGKVQANTWHRLGIVVDGTAGTIRTYIDGAEVGARKVANLIDDRFALSPSATASLFYDDDGETAVAYVNSVQLRDVALSKEQMRALAGAAADGVPQTLPPIPSGIERWIPAGEFASRNTVVGAVIAAGSTTIQDSSISLKLNGTAQAAPSITRDGGLITVRSASALTLNAGAEYTVEVSFTDSLAGAKTLRHVFTAALFYEDFEGITLGTSIEEIPGTENAWTNKPPAGWSIDNSQFPAVVITDENPDSDGDGYADLDGRTEWAGWAFAKKEFWVAADDQTRSQFNLASGTVAIADPDEWDDSTHFVSLFNSFLKTPAISLQGVAANSAFLKFVSSWRPEGLDDPGANFPVNESPDGVRTAINNQTAIISVSYDGAPPVQVLKWDSIGGSPTFHPDSQNESVLLQLNNPAGAREMVLTFAMVEAANDWWWAVDNIVVNAGVAPPVISVQPQSQLVSAGATASLSVTAAGEQLGYQWQFKGVNLPGGTSATLPIANVQAANEGEYKVIVSNPGGSVTSETVTLRVFAGKITDDLVVHLKFDNSLADSSTRNNPGTAVGAPTFSTGKIGTHAVHIPSGADYVSLGAPPDLNFGTSTDFSISFWTKMVAWTSDPSFIGNKDWDSGGNPGYVLSTDGDGRLQWNLAGAPGSRKDYDGPGGTFSDKAWHHVVVTFDRDGGATSFVDGTQRNVTSLTANQNNLDTPENFATNIGQDGAGDYGPAFTDADIDDLGIWRRVLTVQEVEAIFTAGVTGKDLSTALVGGPTLSPPAIATQPASVEVAEGATAALTVAATGDGLTYQWYKGFGSARAAVTGGIGATLNLGSAGLDAAGFYSVEVKNSVGAVTSTPVKLTVLPNISNRTVLLDENFDGLALGPNRDETLAEPQAWTKTPPTGWSIDDTGVPGVGTDQDGITEWAGWSFAKRTWWAQTAGDQQRTQFTKGTGTSAIADSDEWDDVAHAAGNMATYLKTKAIPLTGVKANSVVIKYDSSWRPENPQKANVTVSFDGGAAVEVLRYESDSNSPNFRPDQVNETIAIEVPNPAGASSMVITFGYFETRNNWWWAFDNLQVTAEKAALFFEDFESIALGPNKDETTAGQNVWSHRPPANWTVDNSQMPATVISAENPDANGDGFADNDGRTEWAGWGFARKDWWVSAVGDQTRSQFTKGVGTVAIADPDEWDDQPHAVSLFNSFLKTPAIPVSGSAANSLFLSFDSSWRPEARDDNDPAKFPVGPAGEAINNQTALITVSYDGGASMQVLKWDSISSSPTFHPDSQNESVRVPLNNPAGATSMVISFALLEGANDWWWAVDNIEVAAGEAPVSEVTITSVSLSGGNLTLTWTGGNGPFAVQSKTSLSELGWVTVSQTGDRTATVPATGATGFFRVVENPPASAVNFSAALSGAAERPEVTSGGSGMGYLSVQGDELHFRITYAGLSAVATGAHIHGPALASETAGVMINFANFNGGAFGTSGTIAGTVTLTAEQKTALLEGKTYVNIHTSNNPGGEIRGQVIPTQLRAVLTGAAERPAVTTTGSGSASLILLGNQLTFDINYSGLSAAATAAHIHGPATAEATASVMVGFGGFGVFGVSGNLAGTVTLTPAQLAALADGLTYINIHTANNPGGEIRGQIVRPAAGLGISAGSLP